MKLCIVTHKLIKGDGQGRVNYEIAWEAIHRGYQVTLVASEVDLELQHHSQVRWIAIPVKGWPTHLLRNLLFAWRSSKWLRQHRQFDIVLANGAITWVKSDVNTAHFVQSSWLQSPVHTSRLRRDLYGAYQWLFTAWNAQWEKQAFRQTRVVVAVSEKVKQELMDIGIPAERIEVIVNGVDLQEFHPGEANRKSLGLPEQVPLALFAGDIRTPRKNLDTVLRALVHVPQLHLAVASSTAGSPYPKLAERLGVSARVHFLGYCSNLSEIMRAVDLFVFPSRYEPFGLVVIEAMASGLPAIASATTGAANLVAQGGGIVLPDSDDVQALVQALRNLSGDRQMQQRLGSDGRAIAERYSWEAMAKSYVDLFERLSYTATVQPEPMMAS